MTVMRSLAVLCAGTLLAISPWPVNGQSQELVVRALAANAGRAELDSLLRSVRRRADEARGRGKEALYSEAAGIELRLAVGDFRTGDRLVVELRGETVRTDTLTVGQDLTVRMAGVPPIGLRGVLLAEVPGYMTREIGQYIRNVQTTTTPLRRVGVFGAVANPGYHLVNALAPVSEILGLGRATAEADPRRLTVERGGKTMLDRLTLTAALQHSLSFAALGVESGDIVMIGRTPAPIDRAFWFQLVGVGVALLTALAFLGT